MKHQIHINDQGELLLIDAPEPIRKSQGVYDFIYPHLKREYDQALTSAIEKGIKFSPVQQMFDVLWAHIYKVSGTKEISELKGQSFDVPNSYTAQVVETCKWHGNRDACANETCWDLNECQKSPAVKVAVLIPFKQEPEYKTIEAHICPHSKLLCYDPQCGQTENHCNNSHCFREPGNEAKKDEAKDIQKSKLINYELLLHQITSIVDHFEPSPSNPVYNQWYLLKKHTSDFKKIAGYLTKHLK